MKAWPDTKLRSIGSQYFSLTCQDFSHFFAYHESLTTTLHKSHEAGETPALPDFRAREWSAGVPPAMRATGSRTAVIFGVSRWLGCNLA
jgi:hypothetical protein